MVNKVESFKNLFGSMVVIAVAFQNVFEGVWECGSDCFLKYFFAWKYIKIIFFIILKKLFVTSTHKNDLKIPKNINLK